MVGGVMEETVADAKVYYGGQDFKVTVEAAEGLDNQVWALREKGELPQVVGFETSLGKRVKVWLSESIPLAIEYPGPESAPRRGSRGMVL